MIARYTGGRAARAWRHARGNGAQLARAHRDDGGARRRAQHHDRRDRVLERQDHRRPRTADRPHRPPRSRRPSRWSSHRGIARCRSARFARSLSPAFLLPLTRVFAWIKVDGLQNLHDVKGPVIFAANHQSHMDVPVILAALPGQMAPPRRHGDGEGIFQGAFLSRGVHARKAIRQEPRVLPLGRVLQYVSAAAARSGRAPDAALCGRARQQRLFGADLSRRQANRPRRNRAVSPGRRHDGRAAGRAGDPCPAGRHRSRPSSDVEDGQTRSRACDLRRADAAKWR